MLIPFRSLALATSLCALVFATHGVALAGENAAAKESFSVVLLPDTQNYSESHPEVFMAQTRWIQQHVVDHNIKFAIHLGDIVQNSTQTVEWENADRAMRLLDGVVPYSVLPGNHDIVVTTRDSTLYNKFFSPTRFAKQAWYGGHMGTLNDNNFCCFEACGLKFLVISLEFAPRDEALKWAADVAQRHPDHRVIIATHCYMRLNGRDTDCAASYKVAGNCGEQIWKKFVSQQPNVFLVVSGHILGAGLQTSTNDASRPVVEMLADYQGLAKGGNGWLRLLQFFPGQNKIHVKTYSPLLNETNEDPNETFWLDYEMTANKQVIAN